MKKDFYILFIFLLSAFITNAQNGVHKIYKSILQEDKVLQNYGPKSDQQDSCKTAIRNALYDAQNANFKFIRYGHTGGWPVEYLATEILKKYNISVVFPGCVSTSYARYYNSTIEPYIYQKFSKSIDEILDEEKFNYNTSIGWRSVFYPGGTKKLSLDLECLLREGSIDYISNVWLDIDKLGKVIKISGDTARFTQSNLMVIKNALRNLEFYPALNNYQTVDGRTHLYYSSYDLKGVKCK